MSARVFIVAFAVLAAEGQAWAQDSAAPPAGAPPEAEPDAAPQPPPEPVEVVVTGTRTPESTQRATVRTDVVTRAEAERRGARTVGEALAGQLGVQVNPGAYSTIGSPSAIQIQGFDLDRVLVLQDGERVVGSVGGAIDLAELPLTDVARVEVVAGPMSSLYGASAIGGVVNILSAPPRRQGMSGTLRVEGRSRLGLLAQGNAAYRSGDTWVEADGSYQRQDGVSLLPGSLAVPDSIQTMAGLRAGAVVSERATVQARLRWARQSSVGQETQQVPGLGSYRVDLPEQTDRYSIHVTEDLDLGRGSSLRLSLGRQWALDTSTRDRYDSALDQSRDRSDVLSSFEATATIADGKRTWVFGGRAEVEHLDQDLTNTESVGGELRTTTITEVPQSTLGSAALYGQLGYKLTDELTVMPGVRGELHQRYGGVVVPRLSVAYRPVSRLMVRASGGRGFRAPSAKEFGFAFDHSVYGYRVLGNRDLEPETSWGVSGDVTYRATDEMTLRGGVFANWLDQMIDFVPSPTQAIPGITDYVYQNIGKARTFGGQLDAKFRPAKWLRAEAGYAYLWTRDDTNGRPLQGRPPHTVTASVLVDLPWQLELVTRWRSVTDAFVDVDVRTPGFSTLDARLARPIWGGIGAYLGVLNALDAHKDPMLVGDQRPVAGRTLYVGLTADLPSENDE